MNYSFMARNIDLIIISIESLDPYAIDNLVTRSNTVNIKESFLLRMENETRYKSDSKRYSTYNYFLALQELSLYISQINLQKNVNSILEDLAENQNNSQSYSLKTQNYIRRFIINYRKSVQPYLVGRSKYLDNTYIQQVSIANLFLVSEMNTDRGTYFALLRAANKESIVNNLFCSL